VARAHSPGRNRRGPSAHALSGGGQVHKPMVKVPGEQRESERGVVPLIGAEHNAPGGKGPTLIMLSVRVSARACPG
jgi:hypothetical protein